MINFKSNDNKTKMNYPIYNMLTSCHTSMNIEVWLKYFREEYCKITTRKWPPFSEIVTDFSKANLKAICLAFNEISIYNYLNYIYDNLGSNDLLKNMCNIHLCYAHIKKSISRLIEKV